MEAVDHEDAEGIDELWNVQDSLWTVFYSGFYRLYSLRLGCLMLYRLRITRILKDSLRTKFQYGFSYKIITFNVSQKHFRSHDNYVIAHNQRFENILFPVFPLVFLGIWMLTTAESSCVANPECDIIQISSIRCI